MADLTPSNVLSAIPDELREALVTSFNEIRKNFLEGRWEPSELNGGKLCEIVYRVLEWQVASDGTYTPLGTSIGNFRGSVRKFESDTSLPDGIRFHVPDALSFLYNLRNKRGVGHVGGDVNPNRMDAHAVLSVSNWIMAELVRLHHTVDTETATKVVEALVERTVPWVWEPDTGVRRILKPRLGYLEQVLILLHAEDPESVSADELFEWTEYSNRSVFKKNLLGKAHNERLIEYDRQADVVHLSPLGRERAGELIAEQADSHF